MHVYVLSPPYSTPYSKLYYIYVALPLGAVGWSVECGCGVPDHTRLLLASFGHIGHKTVHRLIQSYEALVNKDAPQMFETLNCNLITMHAKLMRHVLS